MKKYALLGLLCINHLISFTQAKELPNQITLYNPYDIQFTSDNKYLVVSSPNDSKVWNLKNLECLSLPFNYDRLTYGNENPWTYLPESSSFYFHQSIKNDEILSIDPTGTNLSITETLGLGKYNGLKFNNPPSYFLSSDTILSIKVDRKFLPYISVQQIGSSKEIIHEKIDGKNPLHVANRNFKVLKGDNNICYLLSFRSEANSDNGEAVITEINLVTKKTTVIANNIKVYVGDNSFTNSRIESLNKSFETPSYIILNLDGFIYAVRKSDGKVLSGLDLKKLFPENAYPTICGERDGKIIVVSKDWSKNKGIAFHTVNFETTILEEQIFHLAIDLEYVKSYIAATSHDGKEFAIAYKWDEDGGYKLAYIDQQKMTMLRDKSNTAEIVVNKIKELNKAEKDLKEKKIQELQKKTLSEIITRNWCLVSDISGQRVGFGFKLNCDANGNISGELEYRRTPAGMVNSGEFYSRYYDAICNVSGHLIDKESFTLKVNSIRSINENVEESLFKNLNLNFKISLVDYAASGLNIYGDEKYGFVLFCKEWNVYLHEGYIGTYYLNMKK